MRISVLGAGAWGTTLARLLHKGSNEVTLWGHHPERLEQIRRYLRNERFLPGIDLPSSLLLEADLARAAGSADCIVVAVPSKAFREVTNSLRNFAGIIV